MAMAMASAPQVATVRAHWGRISITWRTSSTFTGLSSA